MDWLISNVIAFSLDKDNKLPYRYYESIKPFIDSITSLTKVVENVDFDKPATFVEGGLGLLKYIIEEPPKPQRALYLKVLDEKEFRQPESLSDLFLNVIDNLDVLNSEFFELKQVYDNFGVEVSDNGGRPMIEVLTPQKKCFYVFTDKESEYAACRYSFPKDREKHEELMGEMVDMYWDKHKGITCNVDEEIGYIYSEKDFTKNQYSGELQDLGESLINYKNKGIRRVVVLQGEPGSGKTTLCSNIAEKYSKRTLFLSNSVISAMEIGFWSDVENILKPEMIVIDDVDRVYDDIKANLYIFEEGEFNVPITLMTTNHQDKMGNAFRRPGRIDQIIEMPKPTDDHKIALIKEICESEGVEVTDEFQLKFIEYISSNKSGAFLKEYLRRVKVEGESYRPPDYDLVFSEIFKKFNGELDDH